MRRFVDVCNAIDYAHGRGVLHRDLKPGNVIVGKHGETLVVDWGLAKPMGHAEVGSPSDERTLMPSSSSGSAETLPGSAIGTPAYMSPEQAVGDLERLGPRSDVYSLGATLYCLLTGKAPFEGTDLGAILRDVQKGAFPPPRQVDPSIDRALEAVCLKAMATKPEDRHATARALADDVERWAADEPVSAWREPSSVRARRWMRRNRTAVTAASAAVLMAAGRPGRRCWRSSRGPTPGWRPRTPSWTEANRLKDEANAGLREANGRVQARFDLAREAIRSFQDGVNEDDMLKGEELKGLRDKLLRSAAGFYEKLEKLLQGQTDRPSRAILAQSYFELGDLTEKIGIKPEALAVHRKALAIRRELAARPDADGRRQARPGPEPERRRPAGRGDRRRRRRPRGLRGGPRPGRAAGRRARARPTRPATSSAPAIIGSVGSGEHGQAGRGAGVVRPGAGDPSEAGRGQPRRHRASAADLATATTTSASCKSQTGQPAEALESYRGALAIRQKLAEDNPAVTEFRSNLAGSHNNIGILHLEDRANGRGAGVVRRGAGDPTRSWPRTTPPSPNSAAGWRAATTTSAALRSQAGQTDRALAVVPRGAGDPAEAGRGQPRRHRVPPWAGEQPLQHRPPPGPVRANGRLTVVVPRSLGNPAEAGRGQPRRDRVPLRPGGDPLQLRPHAG